MTPNPDRATTMTSTLDAPVPRTPTAPDTTDWLFRLIDLLARLEYIRAELVGRRLLEDLDHVLWVTEGMVQATEDLARNTRFADDSTAAQMAAVSKAGTFFGAVNSLKRPGGKNLLRSVWSAVGGQPEAATSRAVRECLFAAVDALHAYFGLFTTRFPSSAAARGWVDVASTFVTDLKQQIKSLPAS